MDSPRAARAFVLTASRALVLRASLAAPAQALQIQVRGCQGPVEHTIAANLLEVDARFRNVAARQPSRAIR